MPSLPSLSGLSLYPSDDIGCEGDGGTRDFNKEEFKKILLEYIQQQKQKEDETERNQIVLLWELFENQKNNFEQMQKNYHEQFRRKCDEKDSTIQQLRQQLLYLMQHPVDGPPSKKQKLTLSHPLDAVAV
tara:strand:+ start:8717 stop:9106 length:390 start_codon:yes stop_codon:yes gene_type:complete